MSTPRAINPSSRPALRLVSTKGMNREQWLKVRKQGIGASDAAAAVGLNPYQSPLELWMIKTGRDGLLPAPNPDDIHTPLYWGNLLEPKVAEAYAKATGNKKVKKDVDDGGDDDSEDDDDDDDEEDED